MVDDNDIVIINVSPKEQIVRKRKVADALEERMAVKAAKPWLATPWAELSPEERKQKCGTFLKDFKFLFKREETSQIPAIAFQPMKPYNIAVCVGSSVSIYNQAGKRLCATRKLENIVQCIAIRGDGQLLIAGDISGLASVMMPKSNNILRRFQHSDAVSCCSFGIKDDLKVATGTNDGKFRLWDTTTGKLISEIRAHSGCLKCLESFPFHEAFWITGGFDGKVRLWDLRTDDGENATAVSEFNHGAPVEGVTLFPNGTILASFGGPEIKLWDITEGRLVRSFVCRAGNVSSGCLDSTASVMLSTSLNGTAMVHDVEGGGLLRRFKLPAPILCSAWHPRDQSFAIAMADGRWVLWGWQSDAVATKNLLRLSASADAVATRSLPPVRGANPTSPNWAAIRNIAAEAGPIWPETHTENLNLRPSEFHGDCEIVGAFAAVSLVAMISVEKLCRFHNPTGGVSSPLMLI